MRRFFLLAHLIFIFEPALALLENVTKKMHFLGYIWSTKLHCLEKSLWKRLYLVARQTTQWMHTCYSFLRIVRRIWALYSPRHIVSEMTLFFLLPTFDLFHEFRMVTERDVASRTIRGWKCTRWEQNWRVPKPKCYPFTQTLSVNWLSLMIHFHPFRHGWKIMIEIMFWIA
jgi:hypothetical protein